MKKVINKDGTITLTATQKELDMLEVGLTAIIEDLEYTITDCHSDDEMIEQAKEEQKAYINLREEL